jgi:hypothetical protein
MMVTADDQVKAYIKKIMGQLKEWMYGGKISKLVVVITSKETGEHVERWQFDVALPADPDVEQADNVAGPDLWQERKVKSIKEVDRPRELGTRVSANFKIISQH